jgi:hypothetical protein
MQPGAPIFSRFSSVFRLRGNTQQMRRLSLYFKRVPAFAGTP